MQTLKAFWDSGSLPASDTQTVASSSTVTTNRGYGESPNCSPLQQSWQSSHPTFLAVDNFLTVREYLRSLRAGQLIADPGWLHPAACPALHSLKPDLSSYVQLPMYLWIPEWFFPHEVAAMPCALCNGFGTRQRWNSGGPRVVHDFRHAVYLHYKEYQCTSCRGWYKGTDPRARARLPRSVQAQFPFFLTVASGVTKPMLDRIVNARMSASSLASLRGLMCEARHDRMHAAIIAYYQHYHLHRKTLGSAEQYAEFTPQLSNKQCYYDHDPPSTHTLSEIYQAYCNENSGLHLWAMLTVACGRTKTQRSREAVRNGSARRSIHVDADSYLPCSAAAACADVRCTATTAAAAGVGGGRSTASSTAGRLEASRRRRALLAVLVMLL